MKGLHMVTFTLLVIGGLNWGLVLLGYDIGKYLPEMITKVIYALVAISAIVEACTHKSSCKNCEVPRPMNSGMGQM
jgi:uncharacterized membrane protein YuzA (DUF378 family)